MTLLNLWNCQKERFVRFVWWWPPSSLHCYSHTTALFQWPYWTSVVTGSGKMKLKIVFFLAVLCSRVWVLCSLVNMYICSDIKATFMFKGDVYAFPSSAQNLKTNKHRNKTDPHPPPTHSKKLNNTRNKQPKNSMVKNKTFILSFSQMYKWNLYDNCCQTLCVHIHFCSDLSEHLLLLYVCSTCNIWLFIFSPYHLYVDLCFCSFTHGSFLKELGVLMNKESAIIWW